jgi:hypothetical protein
VTLYRRELKKILLHISADIILLNKIAPAWSYFLGEDPYFWKSSDFLNVLFWLFLEQEQDRSRRHKDDRADDVREDRPAICKQHQAYENSKNQQDRADNFLDHFVTPFCGYCGLAAVETFQKLHNINAAHQEARSQYQGQENEEHDHGGQNFPAYSSFSFSFRVILGFHF